MPSFINIILCAAETRTRDCGFEGNSDVIYYIVRENRKEKSFIFGPVPGYTYNGFLVRCQIRVPRGTRGQRPHAFSKLTHFQH